MNETPTTEPVATAEVGSDDNGDVATGGDDLLAGFDNARRPQQPRTNAYRVVSPFAASDEEQA